MGQDKCGFFTESHVAVPGDDFHGVMVIIKVTKFWLKRREEKYVLYKNKTKE